MGWFKCSFSLLNNSAFWRACQTDSGTSKRSADRKFLIITLMALSSDEISFCNSLELSRFTQTSKDLCSQVWEVLKSEGVLREINANQWSCKEWMDEQGLFGRRQEYIKKAERKKESKQSGSKSNFDALFS